MQLSTPTLFLTAALLLICPPTVHAEQPWKNLLQTATEKRLSKEPEWRKLLHFDALQGRSEVLSADFFLSSVGADDPEKELEDTLRAYFSPFDSTPDNHPRCRFPARYLWLDNHLALPGYNSHEAKCEQLNKWAPLDEVKSVSLLMVSGYFGNPASAFGHTLLKFNSDRTASAETLLDLTFNFGAMVPPNESTLVYIYRGLSGGYLAGFSDSQYYSQDLVYSRTEFRDMWEYELNLSTEELHLLVFHLWEIAGKQFTYYFLTKNCSYRLAEVMELATAEPIVRNARVWYAPIELFHRLHTLDERRDRALIKSIHFVPSSQRVLYHQLAGLTTVEIAVANRIIANDGRNLTVELSRIAPERRTVIADALMAYYAYRLAAEEPEPSHELREAKDRLLRYRLLQPVSRSSPLTVTPITSPGLGSAPMLLSVSAAKSTDNMPYGRLAWSPFHYDLLGFTSLDNSELVVLDTVAGVTEEKIFLDRLDLIRIRVLNTKAVPIEGESRFSWHVRLGADRLDDTSKLVGVANAGVGRAVQLRSGVILYGEVDGWLRSGASTIAAGPNIGAVVTGGRWSSWIRSGVRHEVETEKWIGHGTVDVAYRLAQHRSIRLSVSHEGDDSSALLSFDVYH